MRPSRPDAEGSSLASRVVRASSWLVRPSRRAEWLEEWTAELSALEARRSSGATGVPGPLAFAVGAFPHALSTHLEGRGLSGLSLDLRYSLRSLKRAPAFTGVAVLTLALGIGANGTLLALLNGLLLRPPPGVAEPDALVQIARSYESAPRWDNFSWPAMDLIAAESEALQGVAGYSATAFVVERDGETERVAGQLVTGAYFDVLGLTPAVRKVDRPARRRGAGRRTRRGARDTSTGSRTSAAALPWSVAPSRSELVRTQNHRCRPTGVHRHRKHRAAGTVVRARDHAGRRVRPSHRPSTRGGRAGSTSSDDSPPTLGSKRRGPRWTSSPLASARPIPTLET